MARHTILTNPTANRVMIAMIHLKCSPSMDRYFIYGAAIQKGIYIGLRDIAFSLVNNVQKLQICLI